MPREVAANKRPSLSLPLIVSTATVLADEGGLDAVTMRGVGERLNATGMALYRHVANRDALIELMVDAVVAEFAYPEPRPIGWRAALEAVARQDWRSYFAHPWVLKATASSRPPMGPNTLAAMEWALASFDNLGLSGREQLFLLGTVVSFGQGLALTWIHERQDDTTEWWEGRINDSGDRYPRLVAVTAAVGPDSRTGTWIDEEFEFGLARVLDGIADYLAAR
ncbi:TetR/AcrR family transcriptional regulator [Kibdelosporangium philippinense]|uniref:TetR/AcrR family transcriptional regulator n=1 Tax=Kibdelosporangium philippinense TaxID=211113 RepID=A0ABS8ZRV3_9PSEU|nr:TetR/AcrR family transcriptional regulator [Kibdelosporangium philippinense]MCE7010314.1 TetR/AcrR family transcriptional regulator [Kibdelosporangium philippinense]